MKILFLCNREYWSTKMSRVRFHSIDAIGRAAGVQLVKDGIGFKGFKNVGNSIETHKPDAIIWYKPLKLSGYKKAKSYNIPIMISYNEMHNRSRTMNEITESGTNIVICHLGNYTKEYQSKLKNVKFYNVPHCAEKSIFRKIESKKVYDIFISGKVDGKTYPFRERLIRVMNGRLSRYGCKILRHPGYRIEGVNRQVENYVEEINKAKIVLVTSSKYKYALAKYIEYGMCGVCVCGDIPADRPDWYRKWMVEIKPNEEASKIVNKIKSLIDTGRWREYGDLAYKYCSSETQEKYADKIVKILNVHLGR